MKILYHSVPALFRTGYGVQTKLFTHKLKEAGHEVYVSSNVGVYPTMILPDGIPILSAGTRGNMGNDFIKAHFNSVKADFILSLSDTFVYDCSKFKSLPWIAWQVIDGDPLFQGMKKAVHSCKHNIAMSKFGLKCLQKENVPASYVPLAYDKMDFYPCDKTIARMYLSALWEIELKDRPLIVVNSANMSNPSRKNFGAAFEAFKILLQHYPDAVLYVHAEATGNMSCGENLYKRAKLAGLTPENTIFANQYMYNMGSIDTEYIRMMYNAADMLLNTSMGEAFGVPVIEAYACGCPVLAPACTSLRELVDLRWQVYHGTDYSPYVGVHHFVVDTEAVSYEMEKHLASKDRWTDERIKDCTKRAEPYEIAAVYELHLKPLIDKIQDGSINLQGETNYEEAKDD